MGGAVLSNAFRVAAQDSFDAALLADMDGLIAAAEPDPNGGVMLADRFLNHNFDRVYSGLYYQIEAGKSGGQISRSLFDKEINPTDTTTKGPLTWGSAVGPENQRLRVVSRRVDLTPDGNDKQSSYTFLVAGDTDLLALSPFDDCFIVCIVRAGNEGDLLSVRRPGSTGDRGLAACERNRVPRGGIGEKEPFVCPGLAIAPGDQQDLVPKR